jgi:hypothetical protein
MASGNILRSQVDLPVPRGPKRKKERKISLALLIFF